MVQSVFPDIRIGLYGSRRVADFFAGMPAGIAPRIMKNGVKLMVFCKVLIIREIKDLGWLL